MIKKALCIALCFVLMILCVSCGKIGMLSKTDEVYYYFTDYSGREIVLSKKPEKVAVLFSSFADVWKTAGGEIYVTVGESVERGFADSGVLLVDSGAGKSIDTELLLSYEPDFVICSADIDAQSAAAQLMNEAGIPAAEFRVESFEDYLNMLKICTDITENSEAYQIYGENVRAEIEQIKAEAKSVSEEKGAQDILFIRAGSKYSATKAKTAEDNFVCVMLKELGTYNIAENAPILLDGLSLEEIIEKDPYFIFISTMGDEEAAKSYMNGVLSESTWRELSAVREGRYTYLEKDLFQYKPNSRWAEAYRKLFEMLK